MASPVIKSYSIVGLVFLIMYCLLNMSVNTADGKPTSAKSSTGFLESIPYISAIKRQVQSWLGLSQDAPETSNHGNTKICQTQHCHEVAQIIQDTLNSSVDPCDDFYEYACGSWIKNHDVPKHEKEWSRIREMIEDNENKLIESLGKIEPNEEPNLKKLKSFYKGCMDEKSYDKLGNKPFKDLIKDMGSWALSEDWDEDSWDFYDTLIKLHHDYPAEMFFSVDVMRDPTDKDGRRNIILIDEARLMLPPIMYILAMQNISETSNKTSGTAGKILPIISEYMVDVLTKAGYNNKTDNKIRVADILSLEAKLSLYFVPKERKRYAKVPLSKLTSASPEFPWKYYLEKEFAPKSISNDTELLILANDYWGGLFDIVKKTDAETLSMYMVWREIKEMIPFLPKKFSDIHESFKVKMFGKRSIPRSRKCYAYANSMLGPLVGALFIRKAFTEKSKTEVEVMTKGIIKAFEKRVDDVEWIDKDTDKAVQEKADAATWKIGYPDYLYDMKKFDDRYHQHSCGKYPSLYVCLHGNSTVAINLSQLNSPSRIEIPAVPHDERRAEHKGVLGKQVVVYVGMNFPLNITESNCWARNVIEANKMALQQTREKLGILDSEEDNWIALVQQVNALYVVTGNVIEIPAGILQLPFFYGEGPSAPSYGGIGQVIGHEFTHGFDTVGRHFDKNGHKLDDNSIKWSNRSIKKFRERAECLADQFSNYKLGKLRVNGNQTLSENIADGGGLMLAYKAFQQLVKDNGPEEVLPSLKMSSEELFFLGFAQKMCVHTTKVSELLDIIEDEHAPARYRIIGTLSNFKEFSDAYKCPVGSPMNPENKCEVW